MYHSVTRYYHHRHHHLISFMELPHLLTLSGLSDPAISSKFYHDSFCQLGSSISLPWVIYFEAFYLHVVSSFSFIPVICPKFVLFLTPFAICVFVLYILCILQNIFERPTNTHCFNGCNFIYELSSTYFGQSCGHLQGGRTRIQI